MFSEELRIVDRNTVKYMIEEQQREIEQQKEKISQLAEQIEKNEKRISQQKEKINQLAEQAALLHKELEK